MISTRRVAALAALTLATAGLTGLAAQPATAASDATLTWSFSDYLSRNVNGVGFTSHEASGGATSTGDEVVFSGGEGTGSLAGGDLHLTYDGTVTYTWQPSITFSNPEVVVEGGNGKILADVSWAVPATGSADDVVLTTFDPATAVVTGDSFTATPRWADAGSSWSPELLAALPDIVDAYFHATGSTNDARKAPASFTSAATAQASGPAVAAQPAYAGGAVTIDVDGTGFTAVTQPGDMGVYAVLAPAGKFPETDDFEDQEKVADAEWISPAQMPDGSFSVTLDPPSNVLDPSKEYAVYTWQAHTHSNPSQDTETPVTIDWSKVGSASNLKVTSKPGKLLVSNGTAAGKVTVKLTKGKVSKAAKATMANGTATVKLPKLTKGTWKAKVTYVPSNAGYRPATKTLTIKA